MFGHPSQHGHMMSGVERAVASPKTPAHLKPHLQKRLAGGSTMRIPSMGIQPTQPASGMAPATQPQPSIRPSFPPVQKKIGVAATPKPKPRKFSGLAGGINRNAFFGR